MVLRGVHRACRDALSGAQSRLLGVHVRLTSWRIAIDQRRAWESVSGGAMLDEDVHPCFAEPSSGAPGLLDELLVLLVSLVPFQSSLQM